jgi:hypothetical protein
MQESNKLRLLFVGQVHLETLVVKVHQFIQLLCGAVVEVNLTLFVPHFRKQPQNTRRPKRLDGPYYFTICFTTAETLVLKFASPEYLPVMEWVPTASVLVVNLA